MHPSFNPSAFQYRFSLLNYTQTPDFQGSISPEVDWALVCQPQSEILILVQSLLAALRGRCRYDPILQMRETETQWDEQPVQSLTAESRRGGTYKCLWLQALLLTSDPCSVLLSRAFKAWQAWNHALSPSSLPMCLTHEPLWCRGYWGEQACGNRRESGLCSFRFPISPWKCWN